jgi:acetate CoA/acetoacetate CoA-transferase alpha subunit
MIYEAYGTQRDCADLARMFAGGAGRFLRLPWPLLRRGWPTKLIAGALETFANLAVTHARLPFGIKTVPIGSRAVAVTEEAAAATPFATLLHFRKEIEVPQPRVLLVAPMSGQAVAMIPDGGSLMIGGFMAVGTPERLIDEIVRQNKRDLTVIANDTAIPGRGVGKLVEAKLLRKVIASHIGLNPEAQRQMMAGELEVELVPQGTLIERIRCGGHGLGGILTQTGIGTQVEKGKLRIDVGGKPYLLETALRADFALVQAFLADYLGNLSYALTARNFNPVIAMAAGTVFACAENIVPVGVLPPDQVVTPAPLVDYLVANL